MGAALAADNRELSLLLNDGSAATLIHEVAATFNTDFAHAGGLGTG